MLIEVNKIPPADPIPYEKQVAREMYNAFADHMKFGLGPVVLSQLGYNLVSGIFGKVPETQRAAVFVRFKKELDDAGINYDVASFYQSEQVA
jgi:hypothetical protein